jgi:hypothetical protein
VARIDRPITIYDGGEDGYGYSVRVPGLKTYHWAYNMDNRVAGKAVPALAPLFLSGTTYWPYATPVEWEEADGLPLLLMFSGTGGGAGGAVTWRVRDTVFTNEDTQGSTAPYTDAVLYRYDQDGGVDADEEMIFMCNGSGEDNLFRRKKDATIDQGATSAHDVKADHFGVVGGNLWIAQGYKVSQCTSDADPGKDASYVTKIPVGLPSYSINTIVPLGGSPLGLKGDGVFKWNDEIKEFQNMTPAINPHPDNGKGGFTDGRGRVYYPTADGDILVVTFGFQSQQKPTRITTIDRDTPWGRIGAMTADMEHVYAAVLPGQKRTQDGMGLVVKSDDGGVFTTFTTEVTDRKFGTYADWDAIGTMQSSDYLWIGADYPFWGVHFKLNSVRDEAVNNTFAIAYGTTGGSYQAASGSHDGTCRFAQDGVITLQDSASSDITLSSHANPWLKTTVDSVEKYWMRISRTGSVVSLSGVKVSDVALLPYRPPFDADTFPITGYALATALPKILVGTWQGETIVWQDQWTLDAPQVDQLIVARARYTQSTGERALFALTTEGMYIMPIGADAHPATTPWSKLADYGESGVAAAEHFQAFSGVDFSEAGPDFANRVKAIPEGGSIIIEMPYIQSDDEVYAYTWWDEGSNGYQRHEPQIGTVMELHGIEGQGMVLYMAHAFKDGSRSAVAPYIKRVSIPAGNWEDLGEVWDVKAGDLTSPLTR